MSWEILEDRAALFFGAFTADMNDSNITASNGGPEVIPGFRAYRELSDIDLRSDASYGINHNAYAFRGIKRMLLSFQGLLFHRRISDLVLISKPDDPLILNVSESDYSTAVERSVYEGTLTLSWTEQSLLVIFPIRTVEKESDLTVQNLTFSFRVDNENAGLYCHDSDDPADSNYLICADLKGRLDTPVAGLFRAVRLRGKSNHPVHDTDPTTYPVRKAKLTVC